MRQSYISDSEAVRMSTTSHGEQQALSLPSGVGWVYLLMTPKHTDTTALMQDRDLCSNSWKLMEGGDRNTFFLVLRNTTYEHIYEIKNWFTFTSSEK